MSARIHHLAATTLSKVGESDLAWIAAEQAMQASDTADDPLVLASAARSGTHALLAVGRFDDAMQLGDAAARWLTPPMNDGDPAALSLYGMPHLRSATAATRRQDRGVANELLSKAADATESLGQDANYWQTGFGPTNVVLHRISAGLSLGDISFMIDHSDEIDTTAMPVGHDHPDSRPYQAAWPAPLASPALWRRLRATPPNGVTNRTAPAPSANAPATGPDSPTTRRRMIMAVPHGTRLPIAFDDLFP